MRLKQYIGAMHAVHSPEKDSASRAFIMPMIAGVVYGSIVASVLAGVAYAYAIKRHTRSSAVSKLDEENSTTHEPATID